MDSRAEAFLISIISSSIFLLLQLTLIIYLHILLYMFLGILGIHTNKNKTLQIQKKNLKDAENCKNFYEFNFSIR